MPFFSGAKEQDVEVPNAGGDAYSTRTGEGEERGVWGGRGAHRTEDPSKYTGGGYTTDSGLFIPNDPELYAKQAFTYTPSAREEDVKRYRGIASAYASQPTYKLDYGAANQSLGQAGNTINDGKQALNLAYGDRALAGQARGQQWQALGLQAQAAQGNAPSRAEILGRSMLNQGLNNQLAAASSARGGPLAQMAAQRQAQQGAAQFQQQGINQIAALRADEMERARAQYQAGATGIRGQDYNAADQAGRMAATYGDLAGRQTLIGQTQAGMAEGQGRMEMGQRELNQRGATDFERMAWDTNNAAANLGLGYAGLEQGNYQFGQQMRQQDADRTMGYVGAATGAGGALIGGVMNYAGQEKMADAYRQGNNGGNGNRPYSDMRAKNPAPLLLATGKQPKAANPNWLDQVMSPERAQMQARARQDEHEDRLEQVDGSAIARDNPYGGDEDAGYGGGLIRQDPYGSEEIMYSDEAAKKAAFNQGITYGQGELYSQVRGVENPEKLPEFMRPKQRSLTVTGAPSAAGIDPKAHGEKPLKLPKSLPPRAGASPRPDVTGQKPTALLQQDANRRGAGFPYSYKEEYRPQGQAPGELNYGFSAQELEKNPITATAVKQDPNGMRFIDTDKLLKTNTAGIASLQGQIDELKYG